MCGKRSRAGQAGDSASVSHHLHHYSLDRARSSVVEVAAGDTGREPSVFGGLTCWQEAASFKVYPIPEAGGWGLAALINILEAGWISKFKKFF